MSYSRKFSKTIAVPYSGSKSYSYPASEHGGTVTIHYSGTAYEEVEVDIHVDTAPFESSVSNCNSNVNTLTASVGAMNLAQCAAIKENADKISQTIIDGFFHTVRTELSTQNVELEQAIEAKLILLNEQAKSLREKQKAMANDYARTTARYQKHFSDLNNELSARIHEIDQPVFNFVKDVDNQNNRMLHTDMVQTAITMSKESSILQAQINTAMMKHHALEAMNQAQNYLISKAVSERTIQKTCINGSGKEKYLIPVCYMKTESENKQTDSKCATPDLDAFKNSQILDRLCNQLDLSDINNKDEHNSELLNSYIQAEISNKIVGDDAHSIRVRNMINNLLNK